MQTKVPQEPGNINITIIKSDDRHQLWGKNIGETNTAV